MLKNFLLELFKESPSSADDSLANQGSPSNSGSAERSAPDSGNPANQGGVNNNSAADRSSRAGDGSSGTQAIPNSTPISSARGQAGAPPIPSGIPEADARELRSAGVGSTKQPTNVAAVVESGSSRVEVQNAIDKAAKAGGGIVELKGGDFKIDKTLDLKSGVVLKGADDTRLLGTMTGDTSIVRVDDGVSGAGLKNLTVQHVGNGKPPRVDDFENRLPNAEVTSVEINGNNNMIDNVNIKNSGSDPLVIKGDHNTIQNSNIDGSYNKGGGGNGYIDIRGENNRFTNNDVDNIRHLSIQQGAKHNLVDNNDIKVDVNFHNKDEGHNAVINNTIDTRGHNWNAISTGGAQYGHTPPGEMNYLFGNVDQTGRGIETHSDERVDPNKLMTFSGYRAENLRQV